MTYGSPTTTNVEHGSRTVQAQHHHPSGTLWIQYRFCEGSISETLPCGISPGSRPSLLQQFVCCGGYDGSPTRFTPVVPLFHKEGRNPVDDRILFVATGTNKGCSAEPQ